MWNIRKLYAFFGLILLQAELKKHPELTQACAPWEVPTEDELLTHRPYAEISRIEMQFGVEGIWNPQQIKDMPGRVEVDRELGERLFGGK